MKTYRVIGHEGRITIPFDMRRAVGFRPGDIVSFQIVNTDSVLVCREELSGQKQAAQAASVPDQISSLFSFLEGLNENQRYQALVHLSVLWAQSHGEKQSGRDCK